MKANQATFPVRQMCRLLHVSASGFYNVEAWLSPEGRNDAELQALLDNRQQPYYEHEVVAA